MLAPDACLIFDPVGLQGTCRPQDDDRSGLLERFGNLSAERLAAGNEPVPPSLDSCLIERGNNGLRPFLIGACIAYEDVTRFVRFSVASRRFFHTCHPRGARILWLLRTFVILMALSGRSD